MAGPDSGHRSRTHVVTTPKPWDVACSSTIRHPTKPLRHPPRYAASMRSAVLAALVCLSCGTSSTHAAPDASTPTDASDASPPVDTGTPVREASAPPPGVSWPSTQSFPTFGPVDQLDVADESRATAEQHYLFITLEGLVNRTKPRVYLQEPEQEGTTFWLDKLGVTTNAVADPMTL